MSKFVFSVYIATFRKIGSNSFLSNFVIPQMFLFKVPEAFSDPCEMFRMGSVR